MNSTTKKTRALPKDVFLRHNVEYMDAKRRLLYRKRVGEITPAQYKQYLNHLIDRFYRY